MIFKPVARLGVVSILCLCAGPLAAQQDSALAEREEVTAIDLVVELSKDGQTVIEPPEDLTPEDFSIEVDGRPVAVVGVEGPIGAEPWYTLLYFDYALASSPSIRWAASALADRASSLVDLGDVEVVIADPEPRVLLAATQDADLLDQTLSGIFLRAEADHRILSQREEFVLRRDESDELSESRTLHELAAEEERLVMRQQDAFSSTLIGAMPATSRRVVFLVSDGFDQRPYEFYRDRAADDAAAESELEGRTTEWAQTVAAYGWSVMTLMPDEAERRRRFGVVPVPDERSWKVNLPGVVARLEGTLDPERAAAQHELGQRLAEQGELAESEAALREALLFYHDHPKYALQRAAVLTDLGEVLLEEDKVDEARAVLREAVTLDPGKEGEIKIVQARLLSPLEPLDLLASISGGRVAEGGEALSETLAALSRRTRLTFQLRGAPDGELHPVRVQVPARGVEARSTAWVRFGTPATVSELRARQLLDGELENGVIPVKCRFVEESKSYASRRGYVEIEVPDSAAGESFGARPLRLTLGLARESGSIRIVQDVVFFGDEPFRLPLEVDRSEVWFAAVIDDVESGRWGGSSADL